MNTESYIYTRVPCTNVIAIQYAARIRGQATMRTKTTASANECDVVTLAVLSPQVSATVLVDVNTGYVSFAEHLALCTPIAFDDTLTLAAHPLLPVRSYRLCTWTLPCLHMSCYSPGLAFAVRLFTLTFKGFES